MRTVPNFCGFTFQVKRSWHWQVEVTLGTLTPLAVVSPMNFINEEAAKIDMKKHMPEVIRHVCKALNLGEPAGVLDMATNTQYTFDEFKGAPIE